MNDIFIDAMKKSGQSPQIDDAFLIGQFSNSPFPLDPELTHGCVASSPAGVGYKPFVYFVGGMAR